MKIKFTKVQSGWYDFSVFYGQTTLDHTFDDAFKTPDDLMRWAEKLSNCDLGEFSYDIGGWFWYFDYKDGEFIVSDSIEPEDEDDESDEMERFERLRVKIPRQELIGVIRKAMEDLPRYNKGL